MDVRFAQMLDRNVASLRQLREEHPRSLVLPVATVSDLESRVSELLSNDDVFQANRVFWLDQLVTFEAWRSIVLWRSTEQVDSALLLKDTGLLLGCAVLSRSAFELAVSSLVVSARLCKVLNKIDTSTIKVQFCASNTFPDDVELAIFGTRIAEAGSAGHPSQKNILNYIAQLEKLSPNVNLQDSYDFLCDVAHPSWFGNRPFYRRGEQGPIARVSRDYDPAWQNEIEPLVEKVLSWSAMSITNIVQQSHAAASRLHTVFNTA